MPEKNEVQILFEEHAPGVSADFVRQRGLIDPLSSPVVIAAEVAVAAFPFLWKVFMAWLERHTNGKVTIKYKADENVEITVEHTKLSQKQVQAIVEQAKEKAKPALIKLDFHQ
ncbi:hypothetical protein [Pseudomonas sp. RIT288]|jgi:hypothetical protein|uniref:hypothetical protein n=1 Tax=Pseudomonas sp. RIT288 TaxID=1470589 RepID=UPI000447DA6D|nr:hypothetical protein [Pseudomonas sp. RIT288]EZP33232.1 hypothetical protein BW33_01132 [Pseudomonas sp. RIT288]